VTGGMDNKTREWRRRRETKTGQFQMKLNSNMKVRKKTCAWTPWAKLLRKFSPRKICEKYLKKKVCLDTRLEHENENLSLD
jgi:hypothetical protein